MDRLVDFLLGFYGPTPYLLIFGILLLCGFGAPIPEDITLIAAGLLAYYGVTHLWGTIILCFIGVMLGDSILFILGHHYGRKIAQKGFFKRIFTEELLDKVSKQIQSRGNRIIFAARFMPGVRSALFFTAGTLKIPFWVFFLFDGVAALLSVPTIIGVVYHFGDQLEQAVKVIQKVEHSIVFVILAVAAVTLGRYLWKKRKSPATQE